MNIVAMTAVLTRDPVLERHGEDTVCEMRVAERNSAGEALFITVAAFGDEAERCHTYLRKGRHVAISGRLRYREWEAGGGRRSEHSIAAARVEFLSGGMRPAENETEAEGPPSALSVE